MNVLSRPGYVLATYQQTAPLFSRLFHSSGAKFGPLAKKKLKPKPPVQFIDGVPEWYVKRQEMFKEKKVLAAKFEDLHKQQVIHMPTNKLQAWVTDLGQFPVGMVNLDPQVWGQEIRKDIIHRVVRWQRNSWRAGTHKGKNRAEKSGGGAKPRPQKGTGMSRQGSIRSPLWVGGGRAFPKRVRDHSHGLQLKVVQKGIMIALTAKYQENNMFVIDSVQLDTHRTKELVQLFNSWDIGEVAFIHGADELDPNFALAVRNIPYVQTYTPQSVGVYQLVKRHQVFITKQGLQELELSLTSLPGINSLDCIHPRRRVLAPTPPNFTPKKLADTILQQSA